MLSGLNLFKTHYHMKSYVPELPKYSNLLFKISHKLLKLL
jgi:hypothetical protein